MSEHAGPIDDLSADLQELRARLAEAEETLRAIREGEVDALLITDESGERVYTLRSADAPYRALVERMHEGAATLTVRGGIIYANRSFATLVDTPLEQVIGSSIDKYFDEADRPAVNALIADGSGVLRTCLRTPKRPCDVLMSVSQVTINDTAHLTLIVTDISTLTKVQRESQSKDEFLATLAHELRNPLAPIRTGLQLLRLSPTHESADRMHEMMDRQLTQLVRLIDDLLDVSRVSRGKIDLKKELIDVKRVIALAIETSAPIIEGGHHQLTIDMPSEALPVEADSTRLVQVFSNLLNNAAKYTPDGGRLMVSARRDRSEVTVRVTDNGVGIAKEMLSEVFEMFSQVRRDLDRAQGGLGIGLTLVRRLTEMHGGSVSADSRGLGTGSTFTVRLPVAPARATLAPDESTGNAGVVPPSAERLRVLVVDDNVDAAATLAMLIGLRGHDARLAHDGPDALKELETFHPQIVFLDIGLPGINGYEVAARVRSAEQETNRPRTVLVALTGWGSNDDKTRSRESGFDFHLTKPVDGREVEALLARTCNEVPSALRRI
jgi:signal transduction histidine kinase/ActR/RegA family two-component response regulator